MNPKTTNETITAGVPCPKSRIRAHAFRIVIIGLLFHIFTGGGSPAQAKDRPDMDNIIYERIEIDPVADSLPGYYIYPYRLFIPDNAAESGSLPLVVFLHGYGERGTDNQKQVLSHIQPLIEELFSGPHAAYLVAPQSPSGWWDGSSVRQLVEYLVGQYSVDLDRIYVTGLSRGGHGTWDTIAAGLDYFAAGAPLSAIENPSVAISIGSSSFPVWAFHGTADTVVPVDNTRGMVSQIQSSGGNIRYTEIVGWNHSNWAMIYADSAGWTDFWVGGDPEDPAASFYEWMFSKRRQPLPPTPEPIQTGDRFLLDLGNQVCPPTDSRGQHWNPLTVNPDHTQMISPRLITTTGHWRQVELSVSSPFNGSLDSGWNTFEDLPESVSADAWWTGSSLDHEQSLTAIAKLHLADLPPGMPFRLRTLSAHEDDDGGRERWTQVSVGNESLTSNAAAMPKMWTQDLLVWSDNQGVLEIEVSVLPDSQSRSACVNAVELVADSQTSPAPTAIYMVDFNTTTTSGYPDASTWNIYDAPTDVTGTLLDSSGNASSIGISLSGDIVDETLGSSAPISGPAWLYTDSSTYAAYDAFTVPGGDGNNAIISISGLSGKQFSFNLLGGGTKYGSNNESGLFAYSLDGGTSWIGLDGYNPDGTFYRDAWITIPENSNGRGIGDDEVGKGVTMISPDNLSLVSGDTLFIKAVSNDYYGFFAPTGINALRLVTDTGSPVEAVDFDSVTLVDGDLVLDWTGTATLEEADTLAGPWTAVDPQPTPPYSVTIPADSKKFFRLQTP